MNPIARRKAVGLVKEACEMGIKMTKKLVENKLVLPKWEENDTSPEKQRLRRLRVNLENNASIES